MKLTGIQLGSEKPKELAEFYTKVFGKPSFMDQENNWYGYEINKVGLMIGPHSEVKGKNDCPGRIMVMFDTEDVQKEFDRFVDCGATVVAKPYHPDPENNPDIWLSTVADPDGNYIQITSPWEE